jgi:hypothetical protein
VSDQAHRLSWLIVLALVLVGAINVGIVLVPLRFGDANWEVAAFGELASSYAVPTLGAALLGFLAVQRFAVKTVLLGSVWCALLGSIVTLGGLILALDIPVVLQATRGGAPAQNQLRLLVGKSVVFSGLYALTLWFLAIYYARAFVRLRRVQ